MTDKPWRLFRDGKSVHVFETEADMWRWLHIQHGYSVSHAFKHEGYTATQPDGTPYRAPGMADWQDYQ